MATGNLLLAVVAAAQLAMANGAEGMREAGRDEVLMFGLGSSDKKVSSGARWLDVLAGALRRMWRLYIHAEQSHRREIAGGGRKAGGGSR